MKLTLLSAFLFYGLFASSQNEYSKLLYKNSIPIFSNALIDSDKNGVIVVGSTYNSGLITKIDSSGAAIWTKTIDGFFDFDDVVATSDSSYLIVGSGENDILPNATAHLIKMSMSGDVLWAKNYNINSSSFSTHARVYESSDSNYVLTWSEFQTNNIGIVKVNTNGDTLWTKSLNTNLGFSSAISCINEIADGSILIAGESGQSQYSGFLLKLTQLGQIAWVQNYQDIYIEDITPLDSGFMAVAKSDLSSFDPKISYLKFDNNGTPLWHRKISQFFHQTQADKLPVIKPVNDSIFLVLHQKDWSNEAFLISDQGNLLSSFTFEMDGSDAMVLNDGSALFIGNGPLYGIKSSTLYDPNIALIRTDTTISTPLCAYDFSLTADLMPIESDSIISFIETGSVDVYLSSITLEELAILDTNLCVEFIGGIDENDFQIPVKVYPNSSTGIFNFEVTTQGEITIVVLDSKGQEVVSHESNSPNTSIDISSEADGFYYFKIIDETNREARGKLILIH